MNVAHGKPIYSNPEVLPLEVFQYTPLSQFPLIAYAYLLDDSSPYYLYWLTVLGRLTSLLANILTVVFLYRLLRRGFQVNKHPAFATVVLCFATLTHSAFAIRPDAMTLAVTTAISVGMFEAIQNENTRRIWLLSGLTAIAVLFKQDAFFLLFPVGLFLLIERKWTTLIGGILAFLVGLGLSLGLGHLLFGPYFLYSVTRGIQNPGSLSQAINTFDKAMSLFGPQIIVGISIALYFLTQKNRDRLITLLCLFVVCYVGLGFLGSMKVGAWVNYYSPAILWVSILMGIGLSKMGSVLSATSFALLASSFFSFRQIYFYTMPFVRSPQAKQEYLSKWDSSQKIRNELRLSPSVKSVIIDQLIRNFLFENSVMVNMEYYGVSQFDYSFVRKDSKNPLKYVIYSESEESTIHYLNEQFSFKIQHFKPLRKIDQYTVYARQ